MYRPLTLPAFQLTAYAKCKLDVKVSRFVQLLSRHCADLGRNLQSDQSERFLGRRSVAAGFETIFRWPAEPI